MKDPCISFFYILAGQHFDACVKATQTIAGMYVTQDGRHEFKVPSLAIRLGHLLKKLVTVKQGSCLRQEQHDDLKKAETFKTLIEAEWTDEIASNCHNTLRRRKDNTIEVLPVTDDLLKLRDYHRKEIALCIESLKTKPSYCVWRRLAQLTMTRITIFNKRRGGEMSKLLLQAYTSRPDWKGQTNQEILRSLQPLERKLLDHMDLVQIPGKRNRKVPVLITHDVKEAMDILITNRETVGIPDCNPYCFASRSNNGFLNGWQAMNLVATEAGIENPELVTSTKLRKYNATVSQLLDLGQGEMEWLARHMGHELNIHKDFYRLHDSTIEIAKVSRLLMAIDSGRASKFVGKQLDEIKLDDFQQGDLENEDGNDEDADDLGYQAVEVNEEATDDLQENMPQMPQQRKRKELSTVKPSNEQSGTLSETRNAKKRKQRLVSSDEENDIHSETRIACQARKKKQRSTVDVSSDEENGTHSENMPQQRKRKELSTVKPSNDQGGTHSETRNASRARKRKQSPTVVSPDEENGRHSETRIACQARKKKQRSTVDVSSDEENGTHSENMPQQRKRKELSTVKPSNDQGGTHSETRNASRARKRKQSPTVVSSDEENGTHSETRNACHQPKTKAKSSWTPNQISTLISKFGHLLEKGIYPSGKQMTLAIKDVNCLRNKTPILMRSKLQHIMRTDYH